MDKKNNIECIFCMRLGMCVKSGRIVTARYLLFAIFLINSVFAQEQTDKKIIFSQADYGEAAIKLNQYPQTPTFNCSGKLNVVETLICEKPTLAIADRIVLDAYKNELSLSSDEQKESIKKSQIQWLKKRNECTEEICILKNIEERLGQYEKFDGAAAKFLIATLLSHSTANVSKNVSSKSVASNIDFFGGDSMWGCLVSQSLIKCSNTDVYDNFKTIKEMQQLSNLKKLSVGGGTACALADGKVTCFGFCDAFDLCKIPEGVADIDDVAVGVGHNCILTKGKVVCWGENYNNVLDIPKDIENVSQIFSGPNNSCALMGKSNLKCWGFSDHNLLLVPQNMGDIKKVTIGNFHICALNTQGKVFCWGAGKKNTRIFPQYGQSIVPSISSPFIDISAGTLHTCGITNTKTICWGDSDNRKTEVPDYIVNATQISATSEQSCALTARGVECWGAYEDKNGKTWGVNTKPITFDNLIKIN